MHFVEMCYIDAVLIIPIFIRCLSTINVCVFVSMYVYMLYIHIYIIHTCIHILSYRT